MRINQRNIFLLDGCGALLTAISTGIIIPRYFAGVGLSLWILYAMGILAATFAIYSLCCYFLTKQIKPLLLAAIISANFFYVVLAVAVLSIFHELTWLGRAYFSAEIFILIGVLMIEIKVYRNFSAELKS